MVKVLKVAAIGLTATTLAVLAACSQAPKSEAPPANTSGSAAEQSTTASAEDNSSAQEEASSEEANSKDEATSKTENKAESTYRTVENITFPAPGSDPLTMAFGLRQFTGEPIGSEQIRVTYPTPDQAVVMSTVRGLPDDSINAIRTRYEFKPAEGQAGKWQLVKVTQQNKCQAGRGPEDWTAELCK